MQSRAGLLAHAANKDRLIIDAHLEVWTLDPKFPFAHPERSEVRLKMVAPIENHVEQMQDFGLSSTPLLRLGQQ